VGCIKSSRTDAVFGVHGAVLTHPSTALFCCRDTLGREGRFQHLAGVARMFGELWVWTASVWKV